MTVAVYLLPLISLLVGFWALSLGTRLKVIDHPGHLHKTHDRPTPLVGGFAVALPLILSIARLPFGRTPKAGFMPL